MVKSIKICIYFCLGLIIITSAIAICILKFKSMPNKELALEINSEHNEIIKNANEVKNNYDKMNFSQEFLETIGETNGNTNVVAAIDIPKINLSYPIAGKTTNELLKISPTKLTGPDPNMKGDFCIVGHNNYDKTMFSNISKLENGDTIKLTSTNGYEKNYIVNKKYEIFESDVSCTNQNTGDRKELILITCTNNTKKRLVVNCIEN